MDIFAMKKCTVYLQNKEIQSSIAMRAGNQKFSSTTATTHIEKFSEGLACFATIKPLTT